MPVGRQKTPAGALDGLSLVEKLQGNRMDASKQPSGPWGLSTRAFPHLARNAWKAVCSITTLPTAFNFLRPSFCFSSSFRRREMSLA